MVAQAFWQSFILKNKTLLSTPTTTAVDGILEILKCVDPRLGVEVGDEDGVREVIFSANGCQDLFSVVGDLVKAAPSIDRWRFIAFKPSRGFDFVFRSAFGEVSPNSWLFLPLRDVSGALAIQVCAIGNEELSEEIVRVVIETGVGELLFSELADCFTAKQEDIRESDRWLPVSFLALFLERSTNGGAKAST